MNWDKKAKRRLSRGALIFAGSLLAAAAAKIISSFGDQSILAEHDPLFGVRNRQLFWIVGVIELTICGYCFFHRDSRLASSLVAGIGVAFVVYRAGLAWIGYQKPCTCLGDAASMLHITDATADTILRWVIVYLLIAGFGGFFLAGEVDQGQSGVPDPAPGR